MSLLADIFSCNCQLCLLINFILLDTMGRCKLKIEDKSRALTILEQEKSVIAVATDLKVSRQSVTSLAIGVTS